MRTGDGQVLELYRLGYLLDEALDIAEARGATLIGAHLAQAIHLLDADLGAVRSAPTAIGFAPGTTRPF